MTVEQAVDEVQIARPAALGADREPTGQMRLVTEQNLPMSPDSPRYLSGFMVNDRVS